MYNCRIETMDEVSAFIQNLNYAIDSGAKIVFQRDRIVDVNRPSRFTNAYTVGKLFPNEDPQSALKRELKKLTVENYVRTVKDTHFKNRSEFREFGKEYDGEDVYVKIRVEVFGTLGSPQTYVMSFHFAERKFREEEFPYRNQAGA